MKVLQEGNTDPPYTGKKASCYKCNRRVEFEKTDKLSYTDGFYDQREGETSPGYYTWVCGKCGANNAIYMLKG